MKDLSELILEYIGNGWQVVLFEGSNRKTYSVDIRWSESEEWNSYASHSYSNQNGLYYISGKDAQGKERIYIGIALDETFAERFYAHQQSHIKKKDEFLEDIVTDIRVSYGIITRNCHYKGKNKVYNAIEVALIRYLDRNNHEILVNKRKYKTTKQALLLNITNTNCPKYLASNFNSEIYEWDNN